MRRLALLALVAALCGGCISIPDDVRAEFAGPDGRRPNNYHACPICAKAARAGTLKPGEPRPCLASR